MGLRTTFAAECLQLPNRRVWSMLFLLRRAKPCVSDLRHMVRMCLFDGEDNSCLSKRGSHRFRAVTP